MPSAEPGRSISVLCMIVIQHPSTRGSDLINIFHLKNRNISRQLGPVAASDDQWRTPPISGARRLWQTLHSQTFPFPSARSHPAPAGSPPSPPPSPPPSLARLPSVRQEEAAQNYLHWGSAERGQSSLSTQLSSHLSPIAGVNLPNCPLSGCGSKGTAGEENQSERGEDWGEREMTGGCWMLILFLWIRFGLRTGERNGENNKEKPRNFWVDEFYCEENFLNK